MGISLVRGLIGMQCLTINHNAFPKHLIISILPVEEVPITPDSGTGGFWRVCGGGDHGAKMGGYRSTAFQFWILRVSEEKFTPILKSLRGSWAKELNPRSTSWFGNPNR